MDLISSPWIYFYYVLIKFELHGISSYYIAHECNQIRAKQSFTLTQDWRIPYSIPVSQATDIADSILPTVRSRVTSLYGEASTSLQPKLQCDLNMLQEACQSKYIPYCMLAVPTDMRDLLDAVAVMFGYLEPTLRILNYTWSFKICVLTLSFRYAVSFCKIR